MNDNGNPTGLAGTTQAADDSDDIDITVDDSAYNAPGNPLLAAALGALEQLTAAVESLATLKDSTSQSRIEDLATQLELIAGKLSDAAGADQSLPQEDKPQEDQSGAIATLIDSVRATLEQAGTLIDSARVVGDPKASDNQSGDSGLPAAGQSAPAATQAAPASSPAPAPASAREGVLEKILPQLVKSLDALSASFKDQQLRLSKLEKRFGLPNSAPKERTQKQDPENVSWPMDLNRPMDRASVDQSVSFHENS